MPDIFTPAKRSAVMSLIRGSGNKDPELRMMALFRAHGITGWRRGVALMGKPDFVFRRERVAVFVDGCFWHRHPGCKFAYTPKSRLEFWLPKFERNVARDRVVMRSCAAQAGRCCGCGSAISRRSGGRGWWGGCGRRSWRHNARGSSGAWD